MNMATQTQTRAVYIFNQLYTEGFEIVNSYGTTVTNVCAFYMTHCCLEIC